MPGCAQCMGKVTGSRCEWCAGHEAGCKESQAEIERLRPYAIVTEKRSGEAPCSADCCREYAELYARLTVTVNALEEIRRYCPDIDSPSSMADIALEKIEDMVSQKAEPVVHDMAAHLAHSIRETLPIPPPPVFPKISSPSPADEDEP